MLLALKIEPEAVRQRMRLAHRSRKRRKKKKKDSFKQNPEKHAVLPTSSFKPTDMCEKHLMYGTIK